MTKKKNDVNRQSIVIFVFSNKAATFVAQIQIHAYLNTWVMSQYEGAARDAALAAEGEWKG